VVRNHADQGYLEHRNFRTPPASPRLRRSGLKNSLEIKSLAWQFSRFCALPDALGSPGKREYSECLGTPAAFPPFSD
jgi:hypothetical protein